MKTWNEVITDSYMNGSKLAKEVLDTEANYEKLNSAIDSLRKVIDNLEAFKSILIETKDTYNKAKEGLSIKVLTRLNSEAKVRNDYIDSNFEFTINALSAKKEGETEKETEERIKSLFELPLLK